MDYTLIGKQIRECRIHKHLTRAELAEAAGLSTNYVYIIETARKKPRLDSLVRIANALGTTADQLLVGNQQYVGPVCSVDIAIVFEDCSFSEKLVILQTISALKAALRVNYAVIDKQEKSIL